MSGSESFGRAFEPQQSPDRLKLEMMTDINSFEPSNIDCFDETESTQCIPSLNLISNGVGLFQSKPCEI
jgi:hypothetical protein